MHVKIFGMHTGIGAAAAHTGYMVAKQFLQGLVYSLLYTGSIGLNLPAAIISAIVTKVKEVAQD